MLTQVPMEKLRKDDYVMCYWEAGGGNFAWLVERGNQLFLFVVLSMRSLSVRHWAYNDDRSSVDVVRNVVACMGFQEIPVYAPLQNAKDKIGQLEQNIKMFDDTMAQMIAAQQKAQAKAEAEANAKANAVPDEQADLKDTADGVPAGGEVKTFGTAKVTDIETAKEKPAEKPA